MSRHYLDHLYVMNPDGKSCEFALVVADEWQGKGIGTRMMKELINAARQRGFEAMTGEVMAENVAMLKLVGELGFTLSEDPEDHTIRLVSKSL
jgi:acetyltransferase